MKLSSVLLVLSLSTAPALAQGFVYQQPAVAGGGVGRASSYWIDPSGQNDLDSDAQAWEDFELSLDMDVTRVRWWGAPAPSLGFRIEFYDQDPNTVAVQPDMFPGTGALYEHDFTSYTSTPVGPNLFQYEVTLTAPVHCVANTRYFVSVIGRTPIAWAEWLWAQGSGGVNGTFWWQRGLHMYFHLPEDRAVALAGDDGWPVGTTYCPGTITACPCTNPAVTNGTGCANSTGQGASLAAFGSATIGADTLALSALHCPANQPGLFFGGPSALAGLPFGDGLRCVGGSVVRLGVVTTSAAGAAQSQLPIAAREGLVGGELRHYQYWYRDPAGPCGGGFNTTNALSVQW